MEHMKKIAAGIVGAAGVILIALGIGMKWRGSSSIEIIGGADGPTSIFIAGKVGGGFSLGILFGGILALCAVLILLKKRKK